MPRNRRPASGAGRFSFCLKGRGGKNTAR
jgi:hypothetical protein